MNWFNLTLQLNRYPIQTAKTLLQEIQSYSQQDYEQYLALKKQEIVNFHLNNNAFYRNFASTAAYTSWNELPILQKQDLQRPLDDRLSTGFTRNNTYTGKTSGSSGRPLIFAKDKFSHALSWAEFHDRYQWYNLDLNHSLQARFYGIPLDAIGHCKELLKDKLGNRYRFPIFDLSDANLEKFLQHFQTKKFEYINGYTSAIVRFGKFLQKKNIILKDVCPQLRLCIVTSEMFFKEDQLLLESTLGVPVVNEYGASELGLLAFANQQNQWIVNSESLFVEILDEAGQPVAAGVPGRVVVTSLYNKAHPFIRYDLGDTGSIRKNPGSKNVILEKLFGRSSEIAVLPSGKVIPGLSFYYVTKTVIEDGGNVKEFVVKQTAPGSFTIKYVASEEMKPEKLLKIRKAMSQYLEAGLDINFKHVLNLKRSKRGKLKQFEALH